MQPIKTIEEIREEMANKLKDKMPSPAMMFDTRYKKDACLTLIDYLFAIEVGGEVDCEYCLGHGKTEVNTKCNYCKGLGFHPETVRDRLEGR